VADPDEDGKNRHSLALEAELIKDEDERAAKEASNGLEQIDTVVDIAEQYLQNHLDFKLRLSHLLSLHRVALNGISSYAGNFRPAAIKIGGSKHTPPGAHLVPGAAEEMCDYVNQNWGSSSGIHLAAYTLWRLNWIHPFTDGNGRTARAASYLVLCVKIGNVFYASNTVPVQIADDKTPYYKALEAADAAWVENGRVDVGELEQLLDSYFQRQLQSVLERARGK
jgi:Fic family protein